MNIELIQRILKKNQGLKLEPSNEDTKTRQIMKKLTVFKNNFEMKVFNLNWNMMCIENFIHAPQEESGQVQFLQ